MTRDLVTIRRLEGKVTNIGLRGFIRKALVQTQRNVCEKKLIKSKSDF